MSMNIITSTLLTSALALLASEGFADAPPYVDVRNIVYAGSGCPAGSLFDVVNATNIRINWDAFAAEAGPGVPLASMRQNCQIIFDLDYPSGWTYAVTSIGFTGSVDLEAGVHASQRVSLYFQGQASTVASSEDFVGPLTEDYATIFPLSVAQQIWAPCAAQRALNVNVQARLAGFRNGGRGLITVDAPVASTIGTLQLAWRRCH